MTSSFTPYAEQALVTYKVVDASRRSVRTLDQDDCGEPLPQDMLTRSFTVTRTGLYHLLGYDRYVNDGNGGANCAFIVDAHLSVDGKFLAQSTAEAVPELQKPGDIGADSFDDALPLGAGTHTLSLSLPGTSLRGPQGCSSATSVTVDTQAFTIVGF